MSHRLTKVALAMAIAAIAVPAAYARYDNEGYGAADSRESSFGPHARAGEVAPAAQPAPPVIVDPTVMARHRALGALPDGQAGSYVDATSAMQHEAAVGAPRIHARALEGGALDPDPLAEGTLRPDDRAGMRGPIVSVQPAIASPGSTGFDWSSAGVGVGAAGATFVVALAGLLLARRYRRSSLPAT